MARKKTEDPAISEQVQDTVLPESVCGGVEAENTEMPADSAGDEQQDGIPGGAPPDETPEEQAGYAGETDETPPSPDQQDGEPDIPPEDETAGYRLAGPLPDTAPQNTNTEQNGEQDTPVPDELPSDADMPEPGLDQDDEPAIPVSNEAPEASEPPAASPAAEAPRPRRRAAPKAPPARKKTIFDLDLRDLDRNLSEEERQEWSAI
jgi:hypothetical protein